MWIKLAQDYFNFTKDICIGIVYLSPAQSSIHVHNEVDIHRSLELQVAQIIRSGASCFLVGDFNSRTAQQMDYNTADTNDGYIPLPEEYVVDDPDIPLRISQDAITNEFGHLLLDICKSTGIRIVNGRYFHDEGLGLFTCHTSNGHGVVDYLLGIQSDTQPDQRGYKISWDETKCETYRDNLVSEQSALKLQQIHDMLNSETVDINNIVATLTNVIREAAQPLTRIYSTSRPNRQPERPMWWTAECHARKSEHNRAWRRYKQSHGHNPSYVQVLASACCLRVKTWENVGKICGSARGEYGLSTDLGARRHAVEILVHAELSLRSGYGFTPSTDDAGTSTANVRTTYSLREFFTNFPMVTCSTDGVLSTCVVRAWSVLTPHFPSSTVQ